jgi:hypothetical protein
MQFNFHSNRLLTLHYNILNENIPLFKIINNLLLTGCDP